jgi:hypothetical protein
MWIHINNYMSNITLYLPDEVKEQLDAHPEIRWSEVARSALIEKLNEITKLEILRKYVEKEPFSEDDLSWMDEHDWHPVDEKGMKLSFIKEVDKREKRKSIKGKNIEELFE